MKTELPWLREVSAPSLQQTGRALDTAYRNWFDSLMGKRPDKVKPPTFKKKANRQSARFARNSFRFKNGVLSLSKIGAIPIVWHRRVRGEPSPIGGHEHQDVQLLPWKKVVSGVVASSFVGGPVKAPHRPKAFEPL